MLTGDLRLRVREIIRQVCDELGVEIVKGALSTDHVHMFIAVPPHRAISDAMLVWIAEQKAVPVIPPHPSRAGTRKTDWWL